MVRAALRGLADPVDEPRPALLVRRLERVVVALDPRPDDEVRAELAREVDGVERSLHGLAARRVVGRHEAALAEARIEVEARRHAVDVVLAERLENLVAVLLVELLRVVELVAVDEVAEAVDGTADPLGGRLAGPLRLVPARDEARHHRPERPDSE